MKHTRLFAAQIFDLLLEPCHRRQAFIPSPFELAGYQPIVGINGIILPARVRLFVARLLQCQFTLPQPFRTGLLMIGGGVPKNFAQDIVVAAEILTEDAPMHKYAIQVTVADVRDGALSSSTLKEASSWGKVDTTYEQMVYSEATLAVPLIAGYAYHKKAYESRKGRRWATLLEPVTA